MLFAVKNQVVVCVEAEAYFQAENELEGYIGG